MPKVQFVISLARISVQYVLRSLLNGYKIPRNKGSLAYGVAYCRPEGSYEKHVSNRFI